MVAPKRAKLAEAESEYSELMVGLNAKKKELAEVEARLAALNAKLAEMQVSVPPNPSPNPKPSPLKHPVHRMANRTPFLTAGGVLDPPRRTPPKALKP